MNIDKNKEEKIFHKITKTYLKLFIASIVGGELLAFFIIKHVPAYTELALKIMAPFFICVLILIIVLAKEN